MLRDFSAIGMSRYTNQKAMDGLISQILQSGDLKGHQYERHGRIHMEIIRDMGPFQIVLRGVSISRGLVNLYRALPALREKRSCALTDCRFAPEMGGGLMVTGYDDTIGEDLSLSLTEVYRFYREPALREKGRLLISCYGLSTEGKVLLGKESEQDTTLFMSDFEYEQNIKKRLRTEDVFSVLDGYLYSDEDEKCCYSVLGTMQRIEKLMNPFTEEWVYYIEINIYGLLMHVLINPLDLIGEPAVGRRFAGKLRLKGRFDPARLVLENQNTFF